MTNDLIFLINTAASIFMMGLIWYVQWVHYPSFRFIREEDFKVYHDFHNLRTGLIVMPVMITEIVSSGLLWLNDELFSFNAIGFYLVIGIWAVTFFFSVPLHAKLNQKKEDLLVDRLVQTNWTRTLLWTCKSGISLYLLAL